MDEVDSFSWETLPEFDAVREALTQQAALKARLKIAKLELEIYQSELMRLKPRDSTVKLIGIDDASRIRLRTLFDAVSEIEKTLDSVDANVKFHSYRLDAAKALMYRSRI